MDIKWCDMSEYNGGYPAFSCDVSPKRDKSSGPGVSVSYGLAPGGDWLVSIGFWWVGTRFSDGFSDEGSAKRAAEGVVRALSLLWPETESGCSAVSGTRKLQINQDRLDHLNATLVAASHHRFDTEFKREGSRVYVAKKGDRTSD